MGQHHTVVEFKRTTKIYKVGFWGKRQVALSQLSLQVPAGSVFGFLGANGAGKTTGIKMLLGLQFPTSGEILLWGRPCLLPENKGRVGYLPERPFFHETMSAYEFLNFHRALFGRYISEKKLPSNQELLELVGIPDVGAKRLRDFSKGMLQRVGIAQALVNDPELVVLDEPMSGLDPLGRRDIRNLIQRLSGLGKTIFFSSHILSDVEALCHGIAFLEKGVLKYHGRVGDLLQTANTNQELVFRVPKKVMNGPLAQAEPLGDSYKILAHDAESVKRFLEAIWAEQGQVVSVAAPNLTLEEALFGKGGL